MCKLDSLCDEINREWNEEIDSVAEAICNRLDMIERWSQVNEDCSGGGYGKEKQRQGSGIREGRSQVNFSILPGRQEEP